MSLPWYLRAEDKSSRRLCPEHRAAGSDSSYQDQETPAIEQAAGFTNERQRVEISVEKQDSETGAKVEGAVFGLYAAENINTAEGTMLADADMPLVETDTLLAEAVSGKDGIAVFDLDLPLRQYYIKRAQGSGWIYFLRRSAHFRCFLSGTGYPCCEAECSKENEPTRSNLQNPTSPVPKRSTGGPDDPYPHGEVIDDGPQSKESLTWCAA